MFGRYRNLTIAALCFPCLRYGLCDDDRKFRVAENRNVESEFRDTFDNGVNGMVVDTGILFPRLQFFQFDVLKLHGFRHIVETKCQFGRKIETC